MAELFSLQHRVALVTGGGRGVGAGIARTLAQQGAMVVVNDLYLERAEAAAATIRDDGGEAIGLAADVTDHACVQEMVDLARERFGSVDILVNNAGIPVSGISMRPFTESTPDDWRPMVGLNLYGVMTTTHALVAGMIERGRGRIITIVSDAGRIGEPYLAVYAAAKAGAAGFSRALAKEVGKHGVTCNCLALGSIASPESTESPEVLAKRLRGYPARRLGQPADVAAAVAWLASDEASWVTGQTIPVNGGYSTS